MPEGPKVEKDNCSGHHRWRRWKREGQEEPVLRPGDPLWSFF